MAWEKYKRPVGKYGRYFDKFYVRITQTGMRLSGKSKTFFSPADHVEFFIDDDEWAIKHAEPDADNPFLVQKDFTVRCERFIKDYHLQHGAVYVGNIIDNMLVISNIPYELPIKKQVQK